MAEEEQQEEESKAEETPEGEEPKKSKKMLFIIIGAVVALLVGGGAAFFLMSGDDTPPESTEVTTDGEETPEGEVPEGEENVEEEQAADGEKKEGEGEKAADGETEEAKAESGASAVGHTYEFKTFHLNLGNPIENHYVRLEVALNFKGGDEQKAEIESRAAQLRDAIVSITSRKTREFLLGPDGKDQLRRELLIRINRFMERPVNAVYITDILIE